MTARKPCAAAWAVTLCLACSAPAAPLQGLAVYPRDVRLTTARDRQSLVVQATFADGITRDVTAQATLSLANPALAHLDGAILRSGRQLRINVQFVRVRDDFPLWSGQFDRAIASDFTALSRVTLALCRAVRQRARTRIS